MIMKHQEDDAIFDIEHLSDVDRLNNMIQHLIESDQCDRILEAATKFDLPSNHLEPALLFSAIQYGKFDALEPLVHLGLDINAINKKSGHTPLTSCLRIKSYRSMAIELLSLGADPNAANDLYSRPLYYAAINGSADLVGVLIDRGADLFLSSGSHDSVLMEILCDSNPTHAVWIAIAKRVPGDHPVFVGGSKTIIEYVKTRGLGDDLVSEFEKHDLRSKIQDRSMPDPDFGL